MRVKQRATAPKERLNAMAGHALSSIGDFESLAGIDTCSDRERAQLWNRFRHLYQGPTQPLVDAVMNHCAEIALHRIAAGELQLIPRRH
jgi:hypothetical protein